MKILERAMVNMGSKVYEAPTLKAATKERAQNYERLREQFLD